MTRAVGLHFLLTHLLRLVAKSNFKFLVNKSAMKNVGQKMLLKPPRDHQRQFKETRKDILDMKQFDHGTIN